MRVIRLGKKVITKKNISVRKEQGSIILKASIFECGNYGKGRETIFSGEARANNRNEINKLMDLLAAKGVVDVRVGVRKPKKWFD